MLKSDFIPPVSNRPRIRRGRNLKQVPKHQLEGTFHGPQLGLAHVFDLLGDMRKVELVRQVAAGLGQAAQGGRLLLRPSVDIVVVGRAAMVHGRHSTRNWRSTR